MEFKYQVGGAIRTVRVECSGDAFRISVDGADEREVRLVSVQGTALELDFFGVRRRAHVVRDGTRRLVAFGADCYELVVEEHGAGARRAAIAVGAGDLTAPMPGQIIAVPVSAGDAVSRGQTLIVLEAMKMELRVAAPHDGTVRKVLVSVGEVVERGQPLAEVAA